MYRYALLLSGMLLVSVLGGCTDVSQFPERSLGMVGYVDAVDAARQVMGQYYTVAKVDADNGEVKSLPKAAEAGLMGGSAREVATIYLRKQNKEVVAYASVQVQRRSGAMKQMGSPSYSGVPNQTPAELEAATTAEQNENWTDERQDSSMAYKLLNDLYDMLHKGSSESSSDKDKLEKKLTTPRTETVVQ